MIIYRITNTVNRKIYIGKTSKSIEDRFQKHFYNHLKNDTYLYKSMRKYGFLNFIIEKIEEVENSNILNEREKFWIEHLSPHYNMTKGGDGGDTSKSPNWIKAMKDHLSKRDNSSCASYGMLGKKQTEKHLQSIKKANSCPVVCDGITYSSVGMAQKANPGISIRKRLDNPKYPQFYRLRKKTCRPRKS